MAYAWRTMAEIDFPAEIRALRATYESIEAVSDAERIRKDIAELSEQAGVPDLWDDPAAAQKITSKLSHRQSELERLEKLAARIDDLEVLVELAPGGAATRTPCAEADSELTSLKKRSPSSRSSPCCPGSTTSARPW